MLRKNSLFKITEQLSKGAEELSNSWFDSAWDQNVKTFKDEAKGFYQNKITQYTSPPAVNPNVAPAPVRELDEETLKTLTTELSGLMDKSIKFISMHCCPILFEAYSTFTKSIQSKCGELLRAQDAHVREARERAVEQEVLNECKERMAELRGTFNGQRQLITDARDYIFFANRVGGSLGLIKRIENSGNNVNALALYSAEAKNIIEEVERLANRPRQ